MNEIDITKLPVEISVNGLRWKLNPVLFGVSVDYLPVNPSSDKVWHAPFRMLVTDGWYGKQLETDAFRIKAESHIQTAQAAYAHALQFGA